MDTKILVDAIVRQTTVLIAQLSTAAGIRAPDQARFTVFFGFQGPGVPMFASEAYLVLTQDTIDRLDLTTLEVKQVPEVAGVQAPAIAGDHFYYVSETTRVDRLALTAGRRTALLAGGLRFYSLVASQDGVFVVADDAYQRRLLRIAR